MPKYTAIAFDHNVSTKSHHVTEHETINHAAQAAIVEWADDIPGVKVALEAVFTSDELVILRGIWPESNTPMWVAVMLIPDA